MTALNPTAAPGQPQIRKDIWPVWILVVLVGLTYIWGARNSQADLITKHPSGYYGFVTEAFLSGQISLKITVDPVLATLRDPYAGPQGAHRPHDMSYYRGKFYLYYGVTPSVILFVPWAILTRCHLTELAATAFFCYSGFLLSTWLLVRWKRRYFPAGSVFWLTLSTAILGWGSPIFFMANTVTFYAVPISCAFFCITFVLVCLERALTTVNPGKQAAWIAGGSLWYGLAIGARPNYFLGLPLMMIPTIVLWWRLERRAKWQWTGIRFFAAAIVPAGIVGAALLTYNYLRFDNPFDFGMQYTMTSVDMRLQHLIGPQYIRKGVHLYLLGSAVFVRYFPFLYSGAVAFGMLPHFTFGGVLALLPITFCVRRLRKAPGWVAIMLVLSGIAISNIFVLSLFFGGEPRYLVDYVPVTLLLSCLLMFYFVEFGGKGGRVLRVLFLLLASFTLYNGVFLGLSNVGLQERVAPIAKVVNWVPYAFERLTHVVQGPLLLELEFPADKSGTRDPIVSTGEPHRSGDVVYVEYTGVDRGKFRFFHMGAGGPESQEIELSPGKHALQVDLGSLYPPNEHPLFRSWSSREIARRKRAVDIRLDGKAVLHASGDFYFATPASVYVGRNPVASDVSSPHFHGQIFHEKRLGIEARRNEDKTSLAGGPVRLVVRFTKGRKNSSDPLISTGQSGNGDIFFVRYIDDSHVVFGHDNFGAGAVESKPLELDFEKEHLVEVEMGSLYPTGSLEAAGFSRKDITRLTGRFSVSVDGVTRFIASRPFHSCDPDEIEVGVNSIGASTANGMFSGTILSATRGKIITAANAQISYGALEMSVIFSENTVGLTEPILVTGQTGKGDFVFVHFDDPTHIHFGFDHWGVSAGKSDSISYDSKLPHLLEVSLGALYPPHDSPIWASRPPEEKQRLLNRLEIKMDGKLVYSTDLVAYEAEPSDISVGENSIGGSSCSQFFSGQVLTSGRANW